MVDKHDDARRLIRSDYREVALFKRLKPELMRGFSAPEEAYNPLTAAEVIARNRRRADQFRTDIES